MSTLALTILRFGFLIALWLFVLAIFHLVRKDLYGTRIGERRTLEKPSRKKKSAAEAPASQPANPADPEPAAPPARQNPLSLVVTDGPLAGTTLPLGRSDVIVGRSPDSTLVLDDTYSSSRHARFFQANGSWWIEDLGSTNGTYIHGRRISEPVALTPGLPIVIGRTTMELQA